MEELDYPTSVEEMKQRYDRIVVFVMDSKHRNKGICKALNQEAEAWAKENDMAWNYIL
ncbi:GNAT family N-acetyltransferase [Paenibacillus sp. NPDC055715]